LTFIVLYDIFVDIMYIDDYTTVINGKKYKRALIRESYREGKKVNKRTIANLAHASDSQIEAIKLALKNSDDIVALKNARAGIFTSSGKSVGAVAMLYQVAQILGITKALGKSREAILFLWLVFARLIDQGSRLSAARLARQHVVCEILGVEGFDENDLYQAMDWGCANQAKIESRLFLMHKKRNSDSDHDYEFEAENIFLYDVTSTYLEGNQNELAEYGYNRDKKQGKRQIIYGLLTDKEGIPLSVEAFKGNTKDNKTLLSQIAKIKERFGVKYVTLVGDKGMIKSIEIEAIDEDEKFNYITSITKPQIEKLLKREVISMGLFDEKLAEVFDQEEGKRYILRRNPHRVEEMARTRESKLCKAKNKFSQANNYLLEHSRAKVETQVKNLRKSLEKLKLNDYVEVVKLPLEGGGGDSQTRRVGVGIEIDQDKLDELSKLDGCYVLKTNLEKSKDLSKEIIHERYKALSEVEWAFRTQKTGYLEVRPVFVRKQARTRAHLLITMLSYKLEHFLRKCWKDIDLTVEEGIKKLSKLSSVIIDVRSEKLHRVPKPDKLSEQLLNAVQVKLPVTLPLIENGVDTKTKLQKGRK
jgi:transposase